MVRTDNLGAPEDEGLSYVVFKSDDKIKNILLRDDGGHGETMCWAKVS